jgi:hypothetical protein
MDSFWLLPPLHLWRLSPQHPLCMRLVDPKLCIAATEKKKYFAHVGKKLLFLTAQHS